MTEVWVSMKLVSMSVITSHLYFMKLFRREVTNTIC